MSLLRAEIANNFQKFNGDWRAECQQVSASLYKDEATYRQSYERLTSLQAWRAFLETKISEDSLAFFLEAQNDALTSHVFASLGSWRSALKALRSCIDNTLFCCYYKDHPVELELWKVGRHKETFSELFTYFDTHPSKSDDPKIDASAALRTEYSTLSRAVHASAKSFRMTKDIKATLLWSDSAQERGMWQTRERLVITNVNLLLLGLFRSHLSGASEPGLRDAISLAIRPSLYPAIRTQLSVVLRTL